MFQPQVTSYVLYLNFVMFHNFVEPGGGTVRLFEKDGSSSSGSRADERGRRRGSKVETIDDL
jgi:hypothetical protein